MSEALLEIMEPLLLERERMVEIKARKEGIKGSVKVLRSLGHDDATIRSAIMKEYHLSDDEIEEYL